MVKAGRAMRSWGWRKHAVIASTRKYTIPNDQMQIVQYLFAIRRRLNIVTLDQTCMRFLQIINGFNIYVSQFKPTQQVTVRLKNKWNILY